MSLEVREIRLGGNLKPFLDVVDDIYAGDPNYVRPLDMELRDCLSKKNPFFEHGEAAIFVAYRNGRCVGRITAQVDREHLGLHKDDAGFFGFFDTIDDQEVANALLDRAGGWLRSRRMKSMRGPFSLSVNETLGCLVEGFDTPPMIMMPHHRPYQGKLIEAAGLPKLKDLYAWAYKVGDISERARKAHATIAALPEVTSRPIDIKNLDRDVKLVMEIYNDAWAGNWGFVPFTTSEIKKLGDDLRLIAIPELTRIIELDGEAVAVSVALPNLNEMIGDLNGKLLPIGLFKLLYRLKLKGPKSARLAVLGIRSKLRQNRKYAGLSTFMYVEMHRSAEKLGLTHGELSWTLEDNGAVNAGIRLMGGKIYKRYRLYERSL